MTEFSIIIANREFGVQAMLPSTRDYCRDYLTQAQPERIIAINEADLAFEREKSIREDQIEGLAPRNFSDAYLETIALQRKLAEHLFDWDTLLFHGSVIAVDGVGYLFTAKSGTGKSTHTRLWRQRFGARAVMVNDDKPFLQITESGVWAYGSPWNGKHGLGTNIRVSLKAICILERGEQNQIQSIPAKDTVKMLLQQSNRPQNPAKVLKYLELVDRLAKNMAFYRLHCNMEPEAAAVAYEAMSQPGEKEKKV